MPGKHRIIDIDVALVEQAIDVEIPGDDEEFDVRRVLFLLEESDLFYQCREVDGVVDPATCEDGLGGRDGKKG